MKTDTIILVQDTWEKVKPISEKAAEMFYNRLFSEYPEVKVYFKGDMEEQGKKLMTMIGVAVSKLDNLEEVVQPVKEMGARHAGYGVKDEDYDKVAAALLWTLEQGLGSLFTPKVKAAWVEVYTTVAGVMMEGVKEAEETSV